MTLSMFLIILGAIYMAPHLKFNQGMSIGLLASIVGGIVSLVGILS